MPVQMTLSPLDYLKNKMKILAGMALGSVPRITPSFFKNPCLTSSHMIFPYWRIKIHQHFFKLLIATHEGTL